MHLTDCVGEGVSSEEMALTGERVPPQPVVEDVVEIFSSDAVDGVGGGAFKARERSADCAKGVEVPTWIS